jgi:hypothetical protein
MRLADHMLAARGTLMDIGGFATKMSTFIQDAQRFEIADDVAKAAGDLVYSRPTALASVLPLCRLPYPTMWLEWRGGLGTYNSRGEDVAPTPLRQGMLIETPPSDRDLSGRVGFMTAAWVHTHYKDWLDAAVNFSPISIYFDWRPDGDVRDLVRLSHRTILRAYRGAEFYPLLEMYVEALETMWCKISSPEAISHFFTGHNKWKKFVNDPEEIAAMRFMDHHALPGLSPHGVQFVAIILANANEIELKHFVQSWQADVQGEGTFIECFLAMLNSKNPVVEHEPADLTKLNKARRKSGKIEFLPYTKTRLTMSRSQGRIADARGISREVARQHLVRGHFKIRRTGVYWWSPFIRGDLSRGGVERSSYEVRT